MGFPLYLSRSPGYAVLSYHQVTLQISQHPICTWSHNSHTLKGIIDNNGWMDGLMGINTITHIHTHTKPEDVCELMCELINLINPAMF